MRLAFAALLLTVLALPGPAPAQTATVYPWCTSGAGHEFGGRNCGFVSFEQCMESARGNGQFCDRNPFYPAPPAPTAQRKPRPAASR